LNFGSENVTSTESIAVLKSVPGTVSATEVARSSGKRVKVVGDEVTR